MRIIGHHTCSQQGTISNIEKQGPFQSTYVAEDKRQHKFLGTGYYFWDNNVNMAHAHGQKIIRENIIFFKRN